MKPSETQQPCAKPSLSQARTALRVAGVHGNGDDARAALSLLASLKDRIDALRALLPNLARTIDFLLMVGSVAVRRHNDSDISLSREAPLSKSGVANLAEWLLLNPSPLAPTSAEHVVWLDILAVRWLHSSALRSFGDQIPYTREVWDTPSKELRQLTTKKILPKLSGGALQIGYQRWLILVGEHSPNCHLLQFVDSLRCISEVCFQSPGPRPPKPSPRLDERRLLKSHWCFPRPQEHQALLSLLKRELCSIDIDLYAATAQREFEKHGDYPSEETFRRLNPTWHRCEAALAALSIQTCRPVQSILTWHTRFKDTGQHESDCFEISYYTSKKWGTKYAKVNWVKVQGGTKAVVVLPDDVQEWLYSIHPGIGSPTLKEILPFSLQAWDVRVYKYLSQELGCPPRRAEIICRDLVPRLLYHENANSAQVNFWRSGATNKLERNDRLALVHYLQPHGTRESKSFEAALGHALGLTIFAPRNSVVSLTGESYALTNYQVRLIYESLKKHHDSAKCRISRHNALAHLTLFVCLLATGHRRSTTPFPFPWDFSPFEQLVFICDKLVTGSEARFAPLSNTPLSYLKAYSKNLRRISHLAGISLAAKSYAEKTQQLLSYEEAPPTAATRLDFQPTAGVFFLLDDNGEISRNKLTTKALDLQIESLTEIQQPTRRLRATMAQHLWENGSSGRLVQAFLGHQPELHVHGAASTWSVHDVVGQLAPRIESFFTEKLGCPTSSTEKYFPSRFFPNVFTALQLSGTGKAAPGYEGRERQMACLQHRARAVIRQVIAASLLGNPDENIPTAERLGPKDRQLLEERIREELWNDLPAQRQVSSLLDEQLKRMRRTAGNASHMRHYSHYSDGDVPGPIEVGFSRLLRCAHVFRSTWENSVGVPIGHKDFDRLEALAHLAISLIAFDGVMSRDNVQNLVEAAACSDFDVHRGMMTLRCNVVTTTHEFRFSVRPGTISTALILGIDSRRDRSTFEWRDVEQRAFEILRKLMSLGDKQRWTLARLGLLFRPYWLLRLPGAMYSVATGDQKGPAADAQSEALLYGKRPTQLDTCVEALRRPSTTLEQEKKAALQALKNLFRQARGVREQGEQRRKVQRAKLLAAIRSEMSSEMAVWSSSSQVVYLLLTFIERLLETGGRRVKSLAFTSIEKYFTSIAEELILQAWDLDFESCDADTLKTLFDSVAMKVDPDHGRTVLQDFVAHLRDSMPVPHFGAQWSNSRTPVRTRSSLVLPLQVKRALALLCERNDVYSRQAAVLIAACAGYGLRRLEAFGLSTQQFDAAQPLHLSLTRSGISDLKTHGSRRIIATALADETMQEALKMALNLANSSPRQPQYLFESDSRDSHITSVSNVASAATLALRAATGNPTIVLHHLRHSFATLLGLAIMAPPKNTDRDLHQVVSRLLGPQYLEVTRDILQSPAEWPFGIEALAITLGHADVSTFLDTYFHASHLVIADRCEAWQPAEIQQERLARLLDVDRTKLSKLKKKLASPRDGSKAQIDSLVREIAKRHDGTTDADDANPADSRSPHIAQWALIFRALQYRLNNDLSVDEMWTYAETSLGYSTEQIRTFSHRYEKLVLETGFDDFEPDSSELIAPVASHRVGLNRGSAEREDFVSRSQHWAKATPENRAVLSALLERWCSRVDPISPKLVCTNEEEVRVTMKCLSQLGAASSQLVLQLHGDGGRQWQKNIQSEYPAATWSSARASRGSSRVKICETSIAVHQTQGSKIPDGRDLHRALVGLYLVCIPGND